MNLLKTPFRRTTAALAGAFIGLAGAAAFAAPASAHHPGVAGVASCADDQGNWTVDWEIVNQWRSIAKVQDVQVLAPEDGSLDEDIIGEVVRANEKNVVHGKQSLSYGDETATIKVTLKWLDHYEEGKEATVTRPEDCKPVETPPSEEPSTPPTGPSTPPVFGEAKPIFDITCTSMTIGLDNPEDGVEIPLVLVPSKGEPKELDIKPGEKESATFDAGKGFSVKIFVKGFEDQSETISWENPGGCDTSGGGAGEPSLPLTGAAAGSIAGGAILLLAVGGGLFFLARRRKLKFTA